MLGQMQRPSPPQRGQTPQTPSARQRPAWGNKMGARPQAPAGPPGQMQTAGPPMGSFNNLQIPGRPPIGQPRPAGGGGIMPPGLAGGGIVPRGIPGGEMGGGMMGGPEEMMRRRQVQQAAGVFDKPQPAGPDPRQEAMARQQQMMSQMQSIQPPGMQAGRGGFDPAMMQEKMAQANQMRDQYRMNNPGPTAPPDFGGRPMPDMGALQQRMQMLQQQRGPVY